MRKMDEVILTVLPGEDGKVEPVEEARGRHRREAADARREPLQ